MRNPILFTCFRSTYRGGANAFAEQGAVRSNLRSALDSAKFQQTQNNVDDFACDSMLFYCSFYRSGSHRSEKICVQHAVVSAHVFQTLSPDDVSEPRLYTNISSSSIFTLRTIISNVAVSTSVALLAWVGSASTIIVKIRTNDLM